MTKDTRRRTWLGRVLGFMIYPGVFGIAGTVAVASVTGYRQLSIPLADLTRLSPLSLVKVPGMPQLVGPATLDPAAIGGLGPLVLLGTLGLWSGAVLSITVAAGLVWWWLAQTQTARRFPLTRFGYLCLYGVVLTALTDLFSWEIAGTGIVGWIALVAVLVVLGRLFVAPVTIVRDGRGPLAAIRWSNEQIGHHGLTRWTAPAVGLLGVLGHFAARLSTVPSDPFLGLVLSTVLGTAILGLGHALAMDLVYWRVERQPHAPLTDYFVETV
ncbi:hypothetical protein [Halorhabdus salina]|uniref:hypothetical protein n=1 Tax=Halorhabdus salina TaxID=2750670 RepID=UPI0015EE9EEF|nr:hypothetical protein [Halorhabdus salina]